MNKFHSSIPLSALCTLVRRCNYSTTEKYKELPYFIGRTTLGRNLPVYSEFKTHDKTYTIIRKIDGNINKLAQEVEALIPKCQVEIRHDLMQLKITGQHVALLKNFFTEKGF